MSGGRDDPAQRRAQLVARCAAQRAELGACVAALGTPLRVADRGLSLTRLVRRHPLLVGMLSTVLLVTQRRRLWRLAAYSISAWRGVRLLLPTRGAPAGRRLVDWLQRGAGLWRAWRALRAAPARH